MQLERARVKYLVKGELEDGKDNALTLGEPEKDTERPPNLSDGVEQENTSRTVIESKSIDVESKSVQGSNGELGSEEASATMNEKGMEASDEGSIGKRGDGGR